MIDRSDAGVIERAQANGRTMSEQRAEDEKTWRIEREDRIAELARMLLIYTEDISVDIAFRTAEVFENEKDRRRQCAADGIPPYGSEELDDES